MAQPPRLVSVVIDTSTRRGDGAETIDVRTLADLARVLRGLRRRQARRQGGAVPTYRELAAATGWSHGIIGEYLGGRVLPPTDRFDVLVQLLGATPAEQRTLATARDRVEELRRARPARPGGNGGTTPIGDTVPRQLPIDVFGFTGRAPQLEQLDALLDAGGALAALTGTAGVGKTALAVRWAHRVADRFPDGQLHVDLRGYDPERPLSAAEALARFLRALGVGGADIPADEAERAALYRSALADRRMLIVLDNAFGADHVRPLIPGSASCFVLATSRDTLAGLVAREGARRIALDRLSPAESASLLRTLVGARVAAEPEAAAELAERCTRLPLALRIAAELATARPQAALAELVAELGGVGGKRRRLDSFDAAGDPRTAVRAVFSWSLRRLTPAGARAFTLLGLDPGPQTDAYALAALADCGLPAASALIGELVRAHLLEPTGPDRYAMHDLLHAYAAETTGASTAESAADSTGGGPPDADAPSEQHAALARLLDHRLHAAGAAMDTLFPHERASRPPLPAARTPAPPLDEPEAAGRWLERQRPNLVAGALYAARHGPAGHCVALSSTLWRAFEVSGHYHEALAVHGAAAEIAPEHERARVLANLGSAHWCVGEHHRARECFEQSLAAHQEGADPRGRARALARLALVHERLGDYGAALSCFGDALADYRGAGDQGGEGAQLINLGALYRRLGRYDEAAEHQRRAAGIFARLGDARLEGYALGNLAVVDAALGRHAVALAHLDRALANCRAAGDRGGEGSAIGTIGLVRLQMGDFPRALSQLRRALAIGRETGERSLETETLNTLGETLLAMGRPAASLTRHRAALALAERTGDRFERARALDGAGCALAAAGRRDLAGEHWRAALRIYAPLGVPEAERVRERLGYVRTAPSAPYADQL